jgi:hypothetical protein
MAINGPYYPSESYKPWKLHEEDFFKDLTHISLHLKFVPVYGESWQSGDK